VGRILLFSPMWCGRFATQDPSTGKLRQAPAGDGKRQAFC
jgi:hypothetical protein